MGSIPRDTTEDLLVKLTVDEKILLLGAQNTWETNAIERVGIPSLKVSDGPNGARGSGFFDGTTAACFPACVSLASTFNRSLARRIGKALGEETQTKGAYVLLGPTVCLHRSPLGGRNFEAFSEDPVLSGLLAAEYVKGLQSERVSATVKHFLGNEQDTKRFTVDETISARALRELYLRAFEITIKKSDPWSIMSSYPKINGNHVDAQSNYLQDVLRKQWGYKGLVMSDWGATSNHIESVKYGLDLEMPGPPYRRKPELVKKALDAGLIQIEDINHRVRPYLDLLKKVGKFDDRKTTPEEQAINSPEHGKLIREAGGEGIVLLKNEKSILPLDTTIKPLKRIALLGPLAKYAAAHGGGSASLNCHYMVSPYDAFKERLGSHVEITTAKGAHIFRVYPELEAGTYNRNGKNGFITDFYKSLDCTGEAFYTEEHPRGFITSLMNASAEGSKSMRVSTTYSPLQTGNHYLGFSTLGPSKMYINGELVSHQKIDTPDFMGFLLGVQDEHLFQYQFEDGQKYDIVIETSLPLEESADLYMLNSLVSFHLGFVSQHDMEADLVNEAVELAKDADIAICFVGNNTQWETEGQDLETMTLPAHGSQDRLVAAVAAVQPKTVVVITTGVPVEMPWLDNVDAVLQAWYGGQETGNAILDVIVGDVNPSGRLPVSWPKKYEHTACYGNFGLDSLRTEKVEYVEGVFVGYRNFDRNYGTEKEVMFPFGYGLGYSTFEISSASLSGGLELATNSVTVNAEVKNTSSLAGAEVVQVYIAPPVGSVERPIKSLAGFDKVFMQPGETKQVSVTFRRDAVAYWDESIDSWKVDAGKYEVSVATSSRPTDAKATLAVLITASATYRP